MIKKKRNNKISDKGIDKKVYVLLTGDGDGWWPYLTMEDLLIENELEDNDVIAIYELKETGHMVAGPSKYVTDKKYK